MITPERSIEIQNALGADIIMNFDECPAHTTDRNYIEQSMQMTLRGLNVAAKHTKTSANYYSVLFKEGFSMIFVVLV